LVNVDDLARSDHVLWEGDPEAAEKQTAAKQPDCGVHQMRAGNAWTEVIRRKVMVQRLSTKECIDLRHRSKSGEVDWQV